MIVDVDFGFEIQDFAARIQKQIAKDGLKQAVLIVTADGFSLRSTDMGSGDLKTLCDGWNAMQKPEVKP